MQTQGFTLGYIGIALSGLGSTGSTALILYLAASLEHPALLRNLWFV